MWGEVNAISSTRWKIYSPPIAGSCSQNEMQGLKMFIRQRGVWGWFCLEVAAQQLGRVSQGLFCKQVVEIQVAGGSGVLRWRQAKKQLQRLPSGQQISHISGSSTCCFCFQTQTDPEELFLHYLDSAFRQKSCEKEQSLANNTKEAGRYGCALGLGACTPSPMSATGTTGTPGVFSWS